MATIGAHFEAKCTQNQALDVLQNKNLRLGDQSWYQFLIPAEELAYDSFEKVRLWDEIALALLKKFIERYYTFREREAPPRISGIGIRRSQFSERPR
jgi:hypothetical protein